MIERPDTTIASIVHRLQLNKRLLEKHPENSAMLKKYIERDKKRIVEEAIRIYGN